MPASCKDIRAAVAVCLQNSDCVLIHRNTPSDCVRPPLKDTLPTQCQQLLHGYGECKKGMIDMRKRFRGNKPIANSLELEAGGGRTEPKPVPMLYAGRNDYAELSAKAKDGKDEYEVYTRNDGIEDIRKK
ncbi:hypothetical protein AMS68_000755 [Peltaster fructicola]|uniref:Uncharacterized protein n=1 Tax=Peltaster fructicola TaxID=286661 RepID=A0A6H0XKS7_9PEZI|nr:hypothetical protein AMS68_000755 [Peltaster fructicola]